MINLITKQSNLLRKIGENYREELDSLTSDWFEYSLNRQREMRRECVTSAFLQALGFNPENDIKVIPKNTLGITFAGTTIEYTAPLEKFEDFKDEFYIGSSIVGVTLGNISGDKTSGLIALRKLLQVTELDELIENWCKFEGSDHSAVTGVPDRFLFDKEYVKTWIRENSNNSTIKKLL